MRATCNIWDVRGLKFSASDSSDVFYVIIFEMSNPFHVFLMDLEHLSD